MLSLLLLMSLVDMISQCGRKRGPPRLGPLLTVPVPPFPRCPTSIRLGPPIDPGSSRFPCRATTDALHLASILPLRRFIPYCNAANPVTRPQDDSGPRPIVGGVTHDRVA